MGIDFALQNMAYPDPGKLPVWLVTMNDDFSLTMKEELRKSDSFHLQRCFPDWRSTIEAGRSTTGCIRPITVVECSLPGLNEFNWIPTPVQNSIGVIALLDDLDDHKLLNAFHSGVSGFLLRPSSIPRIVPALTTVSHGDAVLNSDILSRIIRASGGSGRKANVLTNRQIEIVRLITKGYSLREIAETLFISYLTVRTHVKNIHKKLGIRNMAGLISVALRENLL